MAYNKKSFILYSDISEIVDELPREIKGDLFQLIIDYVNDRNPQPTDLLLKTAFAPIKLQLKRDLIKWEEIRSKRSDAGHASAEKKKQQKQQVLTSVKSVQHTSTNSTVNVSVNDNVNDSVNVINTQQQQFENEFLKDQTLLEHTCRITHCTDSGFKEIVKDFFSENTASKKIWLDLHDCNKHFISWLRYYKPKENVVIYKKTKINPVHE